MSESAASAKRSWVLFGVKPAQSKTTVRAAAKRRPPGRGRSGRKTGEALRQLCYEIRTSQQRLLTFRKAKLIVAPIRRAEGETQPEYHVRGGFSRRLSRT